MASPVETNMSAAAFFDLDKTIISKSSTLVYGPSFYRYGLISVADAARGALAQLVFRVGGANHRRMEKVREQVSRLSQGWQAERVAEIVTRHLDELIIPHIYAEARALLRDHLGAGRDVVIVSTSGQEMVGPIGAMLGASSVIATRMEVSGGCYTGRISCYAYGETKAELIRELAAERGYRLTDCYAYSDSVTDLPMLEVVGHPRVVNPDRALRRVARERGWPILAFTSCARPGGPDQSGSRIGHARVFASAAVRRRKVSRKAWQPGTHARPAAGGEPSQLRYRPAGRH
ncbi:MAG: HAD-IB family hydrolase [Nocardiopsaceae bacterium]|nr:HAD-IB family hydrolase [Nocardiopsaceae bacterium]